MIPFGEFAPDSADLNQNYSTIATNVVPGANQYLPLLDISEVSNALTATCQGAVTMEDNDGNNYTFAGDATKLYSISGVTVTDESKALGYTSNSEFWNFVKWNDQVIAAKWGDAPQVLSLGGSTFADLGGTPPQARTIAVVRDFVVTGNTFDGTDGAVTNRVWWSGFQDETEWTPGTNQCDRQNLEGPGGRVQAIVGGEYGIVIMEGSIWRMDYVGTPLVFEFNEIEPGRGTPSPQSVVKQGADVYYLGQDGFYVLKNGTTSESIGAGRVDTYFYDCINTGYFQNVIGAVDQVRSLIVWAFPCENSTDGLPTKLIIYNYKYNKWSTAEMDLQYLYSGATTTLTLEELDAYGTLDTLEASLDDAIWQGGALQLSAFSDDNKLSYFTGSTKAGVIETGEFFDDNKLTYINSVRPMVDGTCTVTLSTRYLLTDSPTWGSPVSVDTTGKANFRSHNKYHRVRVTTSGDFDKAVGIVVDSKMMGER